MTLLFNCLPLMWQGLKMTLALMAVSGVISLSLGGLFGVLLAERLRVPVLSALIEGVVFIYRAVPFYVQLLIVYFVLPELLGFNLEPWSAAVIALGGCSSGYVAQAVRGGINSISVCQWESAFTLCLSRMQTLRSVILPQTVRVILPNLCNEFDAMLKSTAIASSIGLLELTRASSNLVSREMEPVPIYLMTGAFYVCISLCINRAMRVLERRMGCYS